MSLLPMLFSNWWEDLDRPHRIFDQHFGLTLNEDDLPTALAPYDADVWLLRPRRRRSRYHPYDRQVAARRSSGVSMVKADKNQFQVTLDVQQFQPEEVTVKVIGKNVVVEGKHEEKQDEHGWISRQFVRKYLVPEQCDIDQVKSTLSSDGVLTITAPRKELEPKEKTEKIIKIQNTGQPALREEPMQVDTQNSQNSSQNSQSQKNPAQQRIQDKKTVKAA